jgi:zinc/manganese transport system ATP-binding protein
MSRIIFDGAGFAYPDRQVLGGISLALMPGSHTALTGANGSGKSTLLGLAAGILKPSAGTVTLTAGQRPAFVIQHTHTPEVMPCTVRQAVEMGRWPHRRGWLPLRPSDRRVVADALERMGIADLAGRQLTELSGGQRQRALIAQGLAQEARILILDEPTAGLDSHARTLIREAIAAELGRGVTVLEATHDDGDIALAHRVITLADGKVTAGRPLQRVDARA